MSDTEPPMVSTSTPTFTNETTTTTSFTSGRVKWFNNKAGYGFITVSSGEQEGSDVFVHHSAITVEHEQYRYLVQGEYVTFELCAVEDHKHKWQAGTVKGINNGKLMCETRLESRESRVNHAPEVDTRRQNRPPVHRDGGDPTQYRVRTRGPGPREGDEWMLVRRRPAPIQRHNSPQSPTHSQEILRSRKTPHGGGPN